MNSSSFKNKYDSELNLTPVFLDKHTSDKNIDRVRFIEVNQGDDLYTLSAGYHLDKHTKLKSGCLNLHKISNEKFDLKAKVDLEYGVLDYKCLEDLIYTSNSDSSFSFFKLTSEDVENGKAFCLTQTEKIQIESHCNENTCNTLDISNINKNSTILLVMNDGYHHIYDINQMKSIKSIKSHEYGLWSCLILDENLYMTGSEDSLLKLWDARENSSKAVKTNKEHNASVNCIYKENTEDSGNVLITGSYDENVRLIDLRQFGQLVDRQKLDCSIWDINQTKYNNHNLKLIACIYEGFNIFDFKKKLDMHLDFKNVLSLKVGQNYIKEEESIPLHNSIVYGVDSKKYGKDLYIVSCSFYDNLILFWKL